MADASKGGGAGGPGDQPPARPWSAAEAAAAKLAGKKRIAPSSIKNKMKRTEVLRRQKAAVSKTKVEAKRARKREVSEVGDQAAPKQVPRTIETTREADDTMVAPDDEEVLMDEAEDEFAPYFSGARTPKLMITTKPNPSGKIFRLIAELQAIFPNSHYYKRGGYPLRKISEWASKRDFTHLIVLNEKAKTPNGVIVSCLPYGPTACFKLSSSKLSHEIEGHGAMTSHIPEIILNNFQTRLGRRVGRFLGSMFPHNPELVGRRVCTFHNQRDFIFFRQHRYIFEDGGKKVRLQELGPRFTLKLKWVLAGPFAPKQGVYEWYLKRHEMESSRRKFQL